MKKKDLPLVCIVILNWNGGQTIMNCLKSLKKTSYKNYKLILVDNGSTDDSIKQLKKINKEIEIIYLDKNYGYTIGTNVGWKYAIINYDADYICAMDSDIVTIQKDWLNVQIEELEKDKTYGISSGRLAFPDGGLQMFDKNNDRGYFEQDHGQYNFVREVPYIRGACIIIKKSVINKIGYYDESFFYGPNDIDYCYRAGQAGFKVLDNGHAKSTHIAGYTGSSHKKDMIYGPQSEGMLICWFRHNGIIGSIEMTLRQFTRAFITRRKPNNPKTLRNLVFNKTCLKRMFIFFKSFGNALKNYKKIKQNTKVKILKRYLHS